MAAELARLKALASAHTDDWTDALAGSETPLTFISASKATAGLCAAMDSTGTAAQQMREALMLSVQLRMELFMALKPIHAASLQGAVAPWLADPVSMCRYLLRADRA